MNIIGLTDNPGRSQVEQNEGRGGGCLPIQHTEVVTTLKNVLKTKRKNVSYLQASSQVSEVTSTKKGKGSLQQPIIHHLHVCGTGSFL